MPSSIAVSVAGNDIFVAKNANTKRVLDGPPATVWCGQISGHQIIFLKLLERRNYAAP